MYMGGYDATWNKTTAACCPWSLMYTSLPTNRQIIVGLRLLCVLRDRHTQKLAEIVLLARHPNLLTLAYCLESQRYRPLASLGLNPSAALSKWSLLMRLMTSSYVAQCLSLGEAREPNALKDYAWGSAASIKPGQSPLMPQSNARHDNSYSWCTATRSQW